MIYFSGVVFNSLIVTVYVFMYVLFSTPTNIARTLHEALYKHYTLKYLVWDLLELLASKLEKLPSTGDVIPYTQSL